MGHTMLLLSGTSNYQPLSTFMVTSSCRRICHCLYWDKEGRSIKSHCILHLTAPDNDYIRKKNPHHTLTICEMMQLMGSSHTAPTGIVLRASWRDWFSIILTCTNRTVCICHCMFTMTFMEIHHHWLLHSLRRHQRFLSGKQGSENGIATSKGLIVIPLLNVSQARGICSLLSHTELVSVSSSKCISWADLAAVTVLRSQRCWLNHQRHTIRPPHTEAKQ